MAAASANTAGAAIATVVVRLIASLYHFLVPVWRANEDQNETIFFAVSRTRRDKNQAPIRSQLV